MFLKTVKLFFFLLLINKALMAGTSNFSSPKKEWEVGGYALYMKPAFDSTFSYLGAIDDNMGNTLYITKSPGFALGFELETKYHYLATKDMTLNWYHMGGTTHFLFNDDFLVEPRVFAQYTSLLKLQWDAVNLEVGQDINFDSYTALRIFGSVQYTRINILEKLKVLATEDSSRLPVGDNFSDDLTLNAVGPRLGFDLYEALPHNFNIYVKMAAAILTGKGEFFGVDALGNPEFVRTKGDTFNGSHMAVVPQLEAKLGVNYIYQNSLGDLNVNAALMWFNYFDSNHLSILSQTDFGASGIFVGLSWCR